MSEMESVERRVERRAGNRPLAILIQVVAVAAILGGLVGTLYYPHSASLIVAFFGFVVFLISHYFSRR